MATVHPRARGEHPFSSPTVTDFFGSSPRTRGTLPVEPIIGARERFIPAHAGNTWGWVRRRPARPVHPRARGEHASDEWYTPSYIGSSPRTRGTPMAAEFYGEQKRFIPAHAGNTSNSPLPARAFPVHPRARGEHCAALGMQPAFDGSSPRTRGTLTASGNLIQLRRFIPAHAGNTVRNLNGRRRAAVHPRARGEHAPTWRARSRRFGSSPRTRGTRHPRPARAGRSPVHPRARGEHAATAANGNVLTGSSPRTRGTLAEPDARADDQRFIPAHAGNTCQ